jgi:hypothetical protein
MVNIAPIYGEFGDGLSLALPHKIRNRENHPPSTTLSSKMYAAHSRSVVVDFHVINKRALSIFKMPKNTNQYKDFIQQEWYMNMEKKVVLVLVDWWGYQCAKSCFSLDSNST